MITLKIDRDEKHTISPYLYMQFMEPLGAQDAAMEHMGGTVSQGLWQVLYDEDWNVLTGWDGCVYRLEAQGVPTPVEGLCQARVWVTAEGEDEPLFSLTVAWQEVGGNG